MPVSLPEVGGEVFVRHWQVANPTRVPIVMIHDSLGCVELWRDFPEALAQATQRSVYAYDRLGFGHSSARTDTLTASFVREEAEQFFPAIARGLGLDSFVVLGHSVGAAMALLVAANEPEACKGVVTIAGQTYVEERTRNGIRAGGKHFSDPEQFAKLTRYHGDKTRWVLEAWTGTWLSSIFDDWSVVADLPRVHCPVLAIHGDTDEYGSVAFPQSIVDNAAGPARQEIMTDCGHFPHRERPAQVVEMVAGFVAKIDAREGASTD